MMNDIDLVVLWVDGSDPEWQKERKKYLKQRNTNPSYYQDWGWMRYWFRCVEKNLPWIRRVFFVTYGHTPEWLNPDHPKLRIVNHRDYMLPEFLPTYNSNSISLNVHRIKGLSEKFIYAEDDQFFIGKHDPEDFFSADGLPKDYLWIRPMTEQFTGEFGHIILNNVMLINRHFDTIRIRDGLGKQLYSERYPDEVVKDNRKYLQLKHVPGFKQHHMPIPFLKSTFLNIWHEEEMELYKTSIHRFRTIADVNVWAMRDWQLAEGNFTPHFPKGNIYTETDDENLKQLILDESTKMICVNESDEHAYTDKRAAEICSYFEGRFPEPSSFEV